jgi:hypothetical protein
MNRRTFITLLGGAAATWPLAARAQQDERMWRIGVMISNAESDPEGQARAVALRQALDKLGWTEGSRRAARRSNTCLSAPNICSLKPGGSGKGRRAGKART